jgi:hypothetical protein
MTIEAAPTWKGIIDVAVERQVSLVLVGSTDHSDIAARR